jgi:hypothetical protein
MNEEVTCKTGLNSGVIDKEVFEREILLCKQLSEDNNGKCGWGKCKDCGVIPLLYKFYEGKLLEEPKEIARAKSDLKY